MIFRIVKFVSRPLFFFPLVLKKENYAFLSIMPPKRKVTKVDVIEADIPEETVSVKPKRGRKAKEVAEDISENNEIQEEVPKRGRRTKKVNQIDEPEMKKSIKPKAAEKKATKENKRSKKVESLITEPSEDAEVKVSKKQKKAPAELSEDKPNKKSKKVPIEIDNEENEEVKATIKPSKKLRKAPTKIVIEQDEEVKVTEEKTNKRLKKAPAQVVEEQDEEVKPTEKKTKRTKKISTEPLEEISDPKTKKTTKAKDKTKNGDVEKKPKVLINKTATDWSSIDFSCTKKNGYDVSHNLIISTWNVGGMKSWVNKGCLEYLTNERPDIFCVQETKCNESKLPDEINELNLYKKYWCVSKKEGYAGVGIFSVKEPKTVTYGINDQDQDEDGRCITAEYDNFYLVNVYVPNSGRKLVTLPKRLDWNESFKKYISELDEKKPVIICGDMNVSHQEIDLARPQNNTKNAGFTPEEREGLTDFLSEGFVDVYRYLYPEEKDVYSFWTYMANARSKNIGWRLDYFIVSERLLKSVCDAKYRKEILGSDHCPVTLFVNV